MLNTFLASQQTRGSWHPLGPDHGIHLWQPAPGSVPGSLANVRALVQCLPIGGVLLAQPAMGTVLGLPLHEISALDEVDLLVKANHHAAESTALDEELWFYDGELHRVSVHHQGDEILVHPPTAMFSAMARLHALRGPTLKA